MLAFLGLKTIRTELLNTNKPSGSKASIKYLDQVLATLQTWVDEGNAYPSQWGTQFVSTDDFEHLDACDYFLLATLENTDSVVNIESNASLADYTKHFHISEGTEFEPNFFTLHVYIGENYPYPISNHYEVEYYENGNWKSMLEYESNPEYITWEVPDSCYLSLDITPWMNVSKEGSYRLKLQLQDEHGNRSDFYLPFEVKDHSKEEASKYIDLTYQSRTSFTTFNYSYYPFLPKWVKTAEGYGYLFRSMTEYGDHRFKIELNPSPIFQYRDFSLSLEGKNTTIDTINYEFFLPPGTTEPINYYQLDDQGNPIPFKPDPLAIKGTASIIGYLLDGCAELTGCSFSLTDEQKYQFAVALVNDQNLLCSSFR